MIHDGITGRLAEPFSPGSLASAIQDVVASPDRRWGKACREEFEQLYAWPGPAQQYLNLYKEVMANR